MLTIYSLLTTDEGDVPTRSKVQGLWYWSPQEVC